MRLLYHAGGGASAAEWAAVGCGRSTGCRVTRQRDLPGLAPLHTDDVNTISHRLGIEKPAFTDGASTPGAGGLKPSRAFRVRSGRSRLSSSWPWPFVGAAGALVLVGPPRVLQDGNVLVLGCVQRCLPVARRALRGGRLYQPAVRRFLDRGRRRIRGWLLLGVFGRWGVLGRLGSRCGWLLRHAGYRTWKGGLGQPWK